MPETSDGFRQWAIIELMGHQRLAGLVCEVQIAGAGMIRVDVPPCDSQSAFTRFISPAALYAINPVSEPVARAVAGRYSAAPVHAYELPPGLPARPGHDDIEDLDDEE